MSQRSINPAIEERFDDLDTRVQVLESRLDSLMTYLENVERATLGETESMSDYDREPVVHVLEHVQEDLEDLRADAEMAVSIAARGDDAAPDGGPTKAQIARRLSRDEVIRATADGKGKGPTNAHGDRADEVGSVTVSDVKDMAKPQTQLKWKTVAEDAWPALVEEWPCFRVESPEGKNKRLTVDPTAIPADLARVVERSLDRDDIANRVVGGRASGGV